MPIGKFCGPCWQCKTEMWLPQELYDAAMRGRSKITFFCPYGHGQVFSDGESEESKLRRERDMLKQQLAYRDDVIKVEQGRVAAAQDMLKRAKAAGAKAAKRAKAGVCPCCHRTFRQMALHMANKHPDFKAEEVAA